MSRKVGVLDYGSGNLASACRALSNAGADVTCSSKSSELAGLDALVVPGVGSFDVCMRGIKSLGGDELIASFFDDQKPVLGICVGHQVLFSEGVENSGCPGLGLYPGVVEKLDATRLPHVGWNDLLFESSSEMFGCLEGQKCYFVHSFAAHRYSNGALSTPVGAEVIYACHGDDEFIAGVQYGTVTSTQFHPEKSGQAGATLLKNWVIR